MPASFPALTPGEVAALTEKTYIERAACVLAKFLTDFTPEEVEACAAAAYGGEDSVIRRWRPCASCPAGRMCLSCGMGRPVPLRIWRCRSCPI